MLFVLMWRKWEDDGFCHEAGSELSSAIKLFVQRNSMTRKVAIAEFLDKVQEAYSRKGEYPSPCAQQIVEELKYKSLGVMKEAESLGAIVNALKGESQKSSVVLAHGASVS